MWTLCTVGSLVSEQKQNFGRFTVIFDDFLLIPFDNSSANHTSVTNLGLFELHQMYKKQVEIHLAKIKTAY